MSAGPAASRGEAVRLQLLGLVYAAVLVGLVGLSIAFYQHAFDDHVTVTVGTREAGQQLNVGGDVRMNGRPRVQLMPVSKATAFSGARP